MDIKTYYLSVETPIGTAELEVCHAVMNRDEDDMTVTVSTTIHGEMVAFQANTTENALIQLAKHLPIGWSIKSCLSCRYGHFCPVGDYDNELFCVTDFEPKEPRDLWHVTEDDEERTKRSRKLFDSCNQYAPQSKDYFTYSDYYYIMNHSESES